MTMFRSLASPDSLVNGFKLIIFASAILFLVIHIIQSIQSYLRLRQFKGPLWASLSQTWLAHQTLSGGLYLAVADISKTYGKCDT